MLIVLFLLRQFHDPKRYSTTASAQRWLVRNDLFIAAVVVVLAALMMICNRHFRSDTVQFDLWVAVWANSLLRFSRTFDVALGLISTRQGDCCILLLMAVLFSAQSLHGANSNNRARRLAYWAWSAAICLIAYALVCAAQYLVFRATPIASLPQLLNVSTIIKLPLHTAAENSYPSGHGLAYLFFTLMAFKRYRRLGLALMTISTVMLSIRLIIGVHWFSDIVLGSLPMSLLMTLLACKTPAARTYRLAVRLLKGITAHLNQQLTRRPEPLTM